jgi:hypothetical protein
MVAGVDRRRLGAFRGVLEDACEITEWLATQPWPRATSGMFGCSNTGEAGRRFGIGLFAPENRFAEATVLRDPGAPLDAIASVNRRHPILRNLVWRIGRPALVAWGPITLIPMFIACVPIGPRVPTQSVRRSQRSVQAVW